MFIFMFCALVIGSLIVEDKVVQAISSNLGGIRFTKDRLTFAEWHARSNAPNLIFSLAISLVLSIMFPAAGLVVLTAGLISTALSRPWATARQRYHNLTDWWTAHKDSIKSSWERNREPLVDFVNMILAIIRTITWPWRKYTNAKAWCKTTYNHAHQRVSSLRRAS